MSRRCVRPHHLLCLRFFEGKGYSADFVANMQAVMNGLLAGDQLLLATEDDVLCAACPNHESGVCASQEKVARYDRQVLNLCGLQAGDQLSWAEALSLTERRILKPGLLSTVCGDCQWSSICAGKAFATKHSSRDGASAGQDA